MYIFALGAYIHDVVPQGEVGLSSKLYRKIAARIRKIGESTIRNALDLYHNNT